MSEKLKELRERSQKRKKLLAQTVHSEIIFQSVFKLVYPSFIIHKTMGPRDLCIY